MNAAVRDLMNNYRHITVELPARGPVPAFDLAGVERVSVVARQARLLASSNVEDIVAYARSLDAVVQVARVNLRDVFLDLTKCTP
jgi:ABC-2 type transport system ATP-binding protein